ncbi:MAG: Ig-like domain-containing protein [Thermodesulfovibrionales bacterium]
MKRFKARQTYLLFSLMLSVFLITGCGGGGTGNWDGAPATPTDTTRPTVTAVTPLNNATGVAINRNVTATFSEAMDAATISTSTFTLACPAGTSVTGVVTYVAASKVATFNPTGNLPVSTTCTATITTGAKDVAGNALASNFVWTFKTGATADTTAPTVTSTVPANAATGVALNSNITATFSEDMDPATITTTTFTLKQGTTAVAGAVTYAVAAKTATFNPDANLTASITYTATITTGATDEAGNALAANYTWTFTTGTTVDTTAPTITNKNPAADSTGICINKKINATFSEAMDPLTITTETFTVQLTGPPLGAVLGGTISYVASTKIATFTPLSNLAINTSYTVTMTTGVKDVAGNPLASNNVWSFTTGTSTCTTAPSLGTAAPFGNLGGTAGSTNTGVNTVITGDMSSTATTTSSITGFHDSAADIYTETPANIGAVTGKIYSCTVSTTGPTSAAVNAASCTIATNVRNDAITAYNSLTPASLPGGTDPGAGQLGGLTLAPGIYKAEGESFLITGTDLTLDAQGDVDAVWVFQMASTLTVGAAGAPRSVLLTNGAQSKNVFWQVGSSATINGAGGGTMVGTILASSAVSFSTADNAAITTLNGRAAGLNASVTMVNTVINVPAD